MDSDKDLEALLELYELYRMYKNTRRERRWQVRPLNRDWSTAGYHRKVFLKMKSMDEEQFFLHTRMPRPIYNLLLQLVKSELYKPKQRIGPEERLSLTLHFLAHGGSIQSMAWAYKLGRTTVRNIVLETCEALWRVLSPVYLSEPTQHQYTDIANDFKRMWNMPNCVGALDGKHIAIKCPPNSGSLYHNYKKFFSIVLMAACDAKYTFTAVSIGSYGSQSDGGIFRCCPFGEALIGNTLPLPQNVPLAEGGHSFPHYFLGDAAFPLRSNLMRPYPGVNLERRKRIFNYRLSRARRVIENAFGILTARWRILRTTLEFSPENSEKIVLATLVLHNFIMMNDQARWYCPDNYVDFESGLEHTVQSGTWRSESETTSTAFRPFMSFARRGSATAFQLRDTLSEYFLNEGALPFQDAMII